MSSELPLLAHIIMQYSMFSYSLSVFLFNGEQESICKEIQKYSAYLHKVNRRYKTLPIEVKELNQFAMSLLERSDQTFVLEYFKAHIEGLTYA